ncbi:putative membrane protein [Asticcacaulis biprosthecium C19]|uniref:Putative membrane protein n=2 Tax=Asticcacaulis biprosthecium TaxID=76891 RepID=F4QSN0_9CAUL|nr:putative membrane protein [Asticcacaulis biprosthecium C19]
MDLIGPSHSLAMAGLGLGLWLLLWVRLKDWGALIVLPMAYFVAVTGYILVGYLSGHMIFAQLMHPGLAGVLFVIGLIFYGIFVYGVWFGKRPAIEVLQES